MLQKEFPSSNLTKKYLPQFLFQLAGYEYDSSYKITKHPSKFGGSWITPNFDIPLCDKCKAIWKCKQAEGTYLQKNTNGVFHLTCSECGFQKFWNTQGEDNFLDNQVMQHTPSLANWL